MGYVRFNVISRLICFVVVITFGSCSKTNGFIFPFEEEGLHELSIVKKKGERGQYSQIYTTTKVKLNTEENNDGDILCSWEVGDVELFGMPEVAPEIKEQLNVYKGLVLQIELKKNGELTVLNLPEVSARMRSDLLKVYGSDSLAMSSQMFQEMLRGHDERSKDPLNYLKFYFQDVMVCFQAYGKRYENGWAAGADSVNLPMFGGNYPLNRDIELYTEEGELEMTQNDTVPSEVLLASFKDYLMKVMPPQEYSKVPFHQLRTTYDTEFIVKANESGEVFQSSEERHLFTPMFDNLSLIEIQFGSTED